VKISKRLEFIQLEIYLLTPKMCKCKASSASARAAAERTAASIPGPPAPAQVQPYVSVPVPRPAPRPIQAAPRPAPVLPVPRIVSAPHRPNHIHNGRVYLNHWGRPIISGAPVQQAPQVTPVQLATSAPQAVPAPVQAPFIREATRTLAVARTQVTHPQLRTFLNFYAQY